MTRKEKATELFVSGYNCAQAVVAAFCDVTGLDEDISLKLSSSFGAGLGRLRETCGAVSGMAMVAGAIYATADNNAESKASHYALIQKICNKFKSKNEYIICRDLLAEIEKGSDTSHIPDVRTEEYYKTRPCLRYVLDAVDIIEDLIAECK